MSDTERSTGSRRRYRLRWWHPIVVVLLAILLPVGVVLIRFANGWDLTRVRERATAMGLDWQGRQPAVDPDILAKLQTLDSLLQRNRPYWRSPNQDPSYTGRSPHTALPASLLTHHAEVDDAEVQQILALLQELASYDGQGLPCMAAIAPVKPDVIDLLQRLANWSNERLLLAANGDIPTQAIPMLRCIDRWPTGGIIGLLVKNSCTAIIARGLTERLPALQELPPDQWVALATTLLGLQQYDRDQLVEMMEEEWLQAHFSLSREDKASNIPSYYGSLSTLPVRYGLFGRSDYLDDQLDRIETLRYSDDPLQTFARFPERYPEIDERNLVAVVFEPERILINMLEPAWLMIAQHMQRGRLQQELLAAELTGQPWPVDPFTPDHRPLQRIVIDDRLLAAYSVGPDGIDQGGDAENDKVFWLYGHRSDDGVVIWGGDRLPVVEMPADESLPATPAASATQPTVSD